MDTILIAALSEIDRLRIAPPLTTISQARADAMAIALRSLSGHPVSRRKAKMTERRWEWATALLITARVYDHRRGWLVQDIEAIGSALDVVTKTGNLERVKRRKRKQARRTVHERSTPGEGFD